MAFSALKAISLGIGTQEILPMFQAVSPAQRSEHDRKVFLARDGSVDRLPVRNLSEGAAAARRHSSGEEGSGGSLTSRSRCSTLCPLMC